MVNITSKTPLLRQVIVSNDTDTVVALICHFNIWAALGLKELWVQIGTGERRWFLPLHAILRKLGRDICKILIKVHVIIGDDFLNKIGMKHVAMHFDPVKCLENFEKDPTLTKLITKTVEKYLVQIWVGVGCTTTVSSFNELCLEQYQKGGRYIADLPPTSSTILLHILRGHYVLRRSLALGDFREEAELDPLTWGWKDDAGRFMPVKGRNSIPPTFLVICKCGGKCNNRWCLFMQSEQACTVFCHKSQSFACLNTPN